MVGELASGKGLSEYENPYIYTTKENNNACNFMLTIAAGELGGSFIGAGLEYAWALNATNTGGRVFWSGGNIAKNAAFDFANANGMKTIEMTTSGRFMNAISPYIPNSLSRPIWNRLSSNFANGAVGEINVFQYTAGVSLRSTWRNIEYPILKNNNIIYHIVK